VREIEPQAIRGYERALLLDVLAEDTTQRRMLEMRRGMIEDDRGATLGIDFRR
jgi:hypothetical protein